MGQIVGRYKRVFRPLLWVGCVFGLGGAPIAAQALLITFETPDASNSDLVENVAQVDANTIQVLETFDSPAGFYFMDDIDPFADPVTGAVSGERNISFDYNLSCGLVPDCVDPDDPFGTAEFFILFESLSGDVLIDEFGLGPVAGSVSMLNLSVTEQYGLTFGLLVNSFILLDAVLTISNLDISIPGVIEPPPPSSVPEPGTLMLLMTGLGALALRRRKQAAAPIG